MIEALNDWADRSYTRINAAMRRPGSAADTPSTRRLIEGLLELCDEYSLAEPVEVFRGVSHRATWQAIESGATEITDLGFLSTSRDDSEAGKFMYRNPTRAGKHYPVFLHMELQPGCAYIPVFELADMAWDYELEILTGPARLEITEVEREDGELWVSCKAHALHPANGDAAHLTKQQIAYKANCFSTGKECDPLVLHSLADPRVLAGLH